MNYGKQGMTLLDYSFGKFISHVGIIANCGSVKGETKMYRCGGAKRLGLVIP